jgi:hypothetical protein
LGTSSIVIVPVYITRLRTASPLASK